MARGDLLVHLVCLDLRVQRVVLELMVDLESKGNLDLLVLLVIEDPLVYLDQLVQLEQEVPWDRRVKEETRVSQERKDQQDLKDLLDPLVVQDQEESEEKKDQLENLVGLELLVALEIKDLLEWQALWAHLEALEFLDPQVKLGPLDLLVPEESAVMVGHLESLDLLE